jgi:hypothetical protein
VSTWCGTLPCLLLPLASDAFACRHCSNYVTPPLHCLTSPSLVSQTVKSVPHDTLPMLDTSALTGDSCRSVSVFLGGGGKRYGGGVKGGGGRGLEQAKVSEQDSVFRRETIGWRFGKGMLYKVCCNRLQL